MMWMGVHYDTGNADSGKEKHSSLGPRTVIIDDLAFILFDFSLDYKNNS